MASQIKHIYIAVIGAPGSDKTSFIEHCTGKRSGTLESGTPGSQSRDFAFKYNDSLTMHLIDTPSLDVEPASDKTADVGTALRNFVTWLTEMVKSGKHLSGVVFLQPITAAKPHDLSVLSAVMCSKVYGKSFNECVSLVTTRWSEVTADEAEVLERQLLTSEFFQSMIASGSRVFRFNDTEEPAKAALVHILSRSAALDTMSRMSEDEVEMMMASTGSLDSDFGMDGGTFDVYSPDSAIDLDWFGGTDDDSMDDTIPIDDAHPPVLLELVLLNESMKEMGAQDNEMRHLYRDQIKKLRKELADGSDWQCQLSKEIGDLSDMERQLLDRLQQLKDEFDKFKIAADKDREKEREESRRQEKEIRESHSKELKEARDRQTRELETVREDHRQQHADFIQLKESEIQVIQTSLKRDSDQRVDSIKKEMANMKADLESKHKDEMKMEREEMSRQAAEKQQALEGELRKLAKENEEALRQEMSLKAAEKEKALVDELTSKAAQMQNQLQEEISRLGSSLEAEKARVQEEVGKMTLDMDARHKKEMEALRLEMQQETRRQVRDAKLAVARDYQRRERAIADQVKTMLAESKQQRDAILRDVREEVERLEKERAEREVEHKRALAEAQVKTTNRAGRFGGIFSR